MSTNEGPGSVNVVLMTKIVVRQKQSVTRTNLDESIFVAGVISWDRKLAPDVPSRLG